MPETSRIAAGVKAAFREIGDQKVTVTADADTSKAKAQLDEAAKERKAPVKADADTAKAEEQIDKAARERRTKIKVGVDVDQNQLRGLENLLKSGQFDAARSLTGLISAQRNFNKGGFADQLDFSKSFLDLKSAEQDFAKSLQGDVSSGISSGGQAGISALTPALLTVGVTLAAGLVSAFSGLAALLPAGLLGAGGVVGTLALGLDGVKDAWDAAGKAALSSGKDQTEQAKAVQSAQLGLKTATEDEARAQRDVATARKDATKELRDLNSELRHGALDEKQAELNLQQDIFDLQHGTFQNSIDFQKQQLRVLTDQQDLADAKTRNNDLSQKANTLRQQGVEGNPKVVDAEQRLADSIQKVAAAQQTLTAAFKPSADALAQAQAFAQLSTNAQTLVNTLLGMKPAFQGLKFAVQDALFKDLGPQIQQLASSFLPMLQQALVTMASTMNKTFGQLATWLQKPETMSTIQTILNNIMAAFTQFQPVIMTVAQSFLQLTSVGAGFLPQLGQLIGQIAQGFQQFINSGDLGAWIKDGITAFREFIPIGFQMLKFFRDLAPIGLAVLPALQQVFAALAPAVAPLASAFASLVTAVAPLLGLLGTAFSQVIVAIAPAFIQWFNAMGPVITQLANALTPVIRQIAPYLGQMASILSTAMVQGIKTLLPVLVPFVEQAGKLLVAVLPLVPQLVNLAISALPTVQQAIATLLPFMTKWMGYLTNLANIIIPPLTTAVEVLAKAFGTQFDHIKTIVGGVWEFVKPIFETMKSFIDDIVGGLQKLGLIDTPKGATASGAGKYLPKTGAAANGITPIGPPFTGLPPTGPPTTGGVLGGSYTTGLLPVPRDTNPWGPLPAAATTGTIPPLPASGPMGTTAAVGQVAEIAQQFGLTLTSGKRNEPGSYHNIGEAGDFSNGTGNTPQELAFAQYMAQNFGPQLKELIYSDPAFSQLIGNGQNVTGTGYYSGKTLAEHTNHVHVALIDALGTGGGVSQFASPALTAPSTQSPQDQIASTIIAEAQKRGFNQQQTIAVLATAMQESGLNPSASGGGGAWHGIFQQDTSYPGRDDPNQNIKAFFDRVGSPQGDAWQQIFKLQQGTDYNSPGARKGYLSEIQSKQGSAAELYNKITAAGTTPMGTQGDPMYIALDPTVPANQRTQQKGGPNGQQLGQDFVSGIAQVFGIDGSVFPDPMSGGLFKGFKGLMQALTSGGQKGGSYADRYGNAGATGSPGGGPGLPSILQSIIPPPAAAVQGGDGASLLPGGGGGGGLPQILSGVLNGPLGIGGHLPPGMEKSRSPYGAIGAQGSFYNEFNPNSVPGNFNPAVHLDTSHINSVPPSIFGNSLGGAVHGDFAPFGDLKIGSPKDAPGEFMPFQPGSQSGGLLASPMANQQPAGGPMIQDNSVTFHGPVGNMNDANQQAIGSQVPRFRQGVRPLPTP